MAVVRLLVEEGNAPLDARDGQGGTPLYVAAATGQQAIALYLLSKGADVEVLPCSMLQ
jgi:ankyrin repeat protein